MHRRGIAILLGLACSTLVAKDRLQVSVFSDAARDYERSYHADGSPVPERYAIAFGGTVSGTTWGPTQKREDFPELATVIAEHLAEEGYYFAESQDQADLMLVIHWGATNAFNAINYGEGINRAGEALNQLNSVRAAAPTVEITAPTGLGGAANTDSTLAAALNAQLESNAQAQFDSAMMSLEMEDRRRNRALAENAEIIGYTSTLVDKNRIPGTLGRQIQTELRAEVEDPRYYVVVTAYDFDTLVKQNERKLRWITRMSIRVRGNDFMDRVDEMVARAGDFFGRDSGRLIRDYEGSVDIGELQVVGTDARLSDDKD